MYLISIRLINLLFLIQTILNYFNLLNTNIISIIKLLIPVLSIFIASYKLGTKSKQKGYLEGIKLGIIIIGIFITITLLTDKLSIKSLLYYLILMIASILSSMIGINKKKI